MRPTLTLLAALLAALFARRRRAMDERHFHRLWQGACPICDRSISVISRHTPTEAEAAEVAPPRVVCGGCRARLTTAVATRDRALTMGVYAVDWIEHEEVAA